MESLGLPSLKDALEYMHRPPREAEIAVLAAGRHPAQRRLAFEELLAHHLSLKLIKRAAKTEPAPSLDDAEDLDARFVEALPFQPDECASRARCRTSTPTSAEACPWSDWFRAMLAAERPWSLPLRRRVRRAAGCRLR